MLDRDTAFARHEEVDARASGATGTSPLSVSELGAIWSDLTSGVAHVVRNVCSDEYCFLRIEPRIGKKRRAPRRRSVELLERWLLGTTQKELALERHRCLSSIATAITRSLRDLGVAGTARAVPPSLFVLAHAARGRCGLSVRGRVYDDAGRTIREVHVRRPDAALAGLLTPCEYAAIRSVFEGKTYAEIATLRQTSTRTIANQVARTYAKLGISGRSEFLCALVLGPRRDGQDVAS